LWQTCPELGRYRDLFDQALRERQVVHRHKEQLTTSSGVIYRDVDVFPLSTNNLEGAVLRIDDVTDHVRIEEMMRQSAKMASVGRLAAGIAHEINNPLSGMMQSAQILQMTFDTRRPRTRKLLQACGVDPDDLDHYLDERGAFEYLEGIRSVGGRAAKIVSDLLSFSRKGVAEPALYDLNALVERTLDLAATDYDLKQKYDFRDIDILRELTPDLPAVLCDGPQIQQVVLNLVRNAAQEMARKKEKMMDTPESGEYRPRLTLRTSLVQDVPDEHHGGQAVRLEIEDNGPGVAEDMQTRLFEPFFTTKEAGEGTGLGLWLCWSIVVERHKGRLWVEPSARGGAHFVIELPVEGIGSR
jgi:signal transduction histidine kinase